MQTNMVAQATKCCEDVAVFCTEKTTQKVLLVSVAFSPKKTVF